MWLFDEVHGNRPLGLVFLRPVLLQLLQRDHSIVRANNKLLKVDHKEGRESHGEEGPSFRAHRRNPRGVVAPQIRRRVQHHEIRGRESHHQVLLHENHQVRVYSSSNKID